MARNDNEKVRASRALQDAAAGGAAYRHLLLPEFKLVTVSVAVRKFWNTPHQQWAYLQFKADGRTVTRYIGKVTAETKEEAVRIGWAKLRERKLVEANGWTWDVEPKS
jgi:hypothetical protein